jgi:hypothetical protein
VEIYIPSEEEIACLDQKGLAELDKQISIQRLYLSKQIQNHQDANLILFVPNKPNPKQKELLDAWLNREYKVFTYTGGNRTGKTTVEIWIALSVLFGEYLWNGAKINFPHLGPRKVRVIGQDWEKHIKAVLEPAIEKWWPKSRKCDVKKNNQGIKSFWVDLKTGSTLEIMSNNQESDLHEGWEGDLVTYDEPPKRDIRVANARGLIDRKGRELFCMTLLKEPWIDREVIKARLEDGRPDPSIYNVHAVTWDNVGFGIDEEGIDQFSKTLKPEEIQARLYGKPSYMSGIVLPEFKREIHLKSMPRKGLPLDWITDIAIDFHPSKPWAVLFKTVDQRNFHYVTFEIWEHGSWKYIGEEIIRKIKDNHLRVENIIIDPLAKGDAQSDLAEETVFDKLSKLFMSYGYLLSTASKDKENGIHMIQDLLMTENEMPALFFVDSLKRTIYEIEGWMYDEYGKPQKVDDDMMENLYRLVLLGTQWYPYEEKEPEYVPYQPNNQGLFQNQSIAGY